MFKIFFFNGYIWSAIARERLKLFAQIVAESTDCSHSKPGLHILQMALVLKNKFLLSLTPKINRYLMPQLIFHSLSVSSYSVPYPYHYHLDYPLFDASSHFNLLPVSFHSLTYPFQYVLDNPLFNVSAVVSLFAWEFIPFTV